MPRLGIGQKAQDVTERTLGVSTLGALIDGVSSGRFTTMEGDEVEGLLVFRFGTACCQ